MCKFEVICKCGHVGRKNYIAIAFPVVAENRKDAALKARYFPRVKHDHKDAILSVRKITDEEFDVLLKKNNDDEYLHCSNKQDQNLIDLEGRVFEEDAYSLDNYIEEEMHKTIFYKKNKIRNPKKFFKNIYMTNRGEAYVW